ncbi:hypothetical protein [Carboxylicivirga caseinilyticus]|nr:hypothetical protein [Marinilabiliaceae bacterium A049]
MNWLKKLSNVLDKIKLITKVVRAIDAAIDAAKLILDEKEKNNEKE